MSTESKTTAASSGEPPDDLDGNPNELPDPVEGAVVPSETSLEAAGFVDIDEYHPEVANRSHLRSKLFLKWDPTSGFFKIGDDIIACGPNQGDLLCTVSLVLFGWQYWLSDMGGLGCENNNPGKNPYGDWREGERIVPRKCSDCSKNSLNNPPKGDSCKDAVNIALSISLNGTERLAKFSSSNFKVVNDFNNFLDQLKVIGVHLRNSTLKVSRGDSVEVNKKKLFGWKLQVVSQNKPLGQYLREQAALTVKA